MKKDSVFIDSGAYSAKSKGTPINIETYCKFLLDNKEDLHMYSNLDEIGDPKTTLENQRIMESHGLSPIPVFHLGTDFKYFKRYARKYDYISVGGLVGLSFSQLQQGLQNIFDYIKGDPIKIHGFGITSFRLMRMFPWFSLDSGSLILAAAYGRIYLPRIKNTNEFDFSKLESFIISDQGKHVTNTDMSYLTTPMSCRELWQSLFEEAGVELGEITYQEKRQTRKQRKSKLDTSQLSFDLVDIQTPDLQKQTLANSYKSRIMFNLVMWQKMQETLPHNEFGVPVRLYFVLSSAITHYQLFTSDFPQNCPRILLSYFYIGESAMERVQRYQKGPSWV